jgi:hypothetical protein
MPRMLAILITVVVTLVCIAALLTVFAWGMSVVGQWLIRNGARFQALYQTGTEWLEGHGLIVAGQLAETFNVSWFVRMIQTMLARLNGLAGFATLVFAFAVLGLLEVEQLVSRLKAAGSRFGGIDIIAVGRETAGHFRKYMLVRTLASAVTGAIVWIIAYMVGLELPSRLGGHCLHAELHSLPWAPGGNRAAHAVCAGAIRILGGGGAGAGLPHRRAVHHRQLPGTDLHRLDPVDLALRGDVHGVPVEHAVGLDRRLHRRAHPGRGADRVPPAALHALADRHAGGRQGLLARAYRDLTSPENPAMASRLSAHPTTAWK